MTDTLRVHLNRGSVHDVEPEASDLETAGSFTLALENHGVPTHAHVRLDDTLAAVADVPTTNYYVESGATEVVYVDVEPFSGHIDGAIDVMTGYGSTGEQIAVHLDGSESEQVMVDEQLGERPAVDDQLDASPDVREAIAPTLLAAAGVLLAALAMVFVSDTAAILVGLAALFAGLGTAGYLLLRE